MRKKVNYEKTKEVILNGLAETARLWKDGFSGWSQYIYFDPENSEIYKTSSHCNNTSWNDMDEDLLYMQEAWDIDGDGIDLDSFEKCDNCNEFFCLNCLKEIIEDNYLHDEVYSQVSENLEKLGHEID